MEIGDGGIGDSGIGDIGIGDVGIGDVGIGGALTRSSGIDAGSGTMVGRSASKVMPGIFAGMSGKGTAG